MLRKGGCCWVFLPEGFAVLGVEVNGPQPFGRPVRAQTADVHGEVIELVAARRRPGFVDQRDGYAVVGIHAPAVLVEGVTEGSRKLQEHKRQVVIPAGTVQGPGAGAISITMSSAKLSKAGP